MVDAQAKVAGQWQFHEKITNKNVEKHCSKMNK